MKPPYMGIIGISLQAECWKRDKGSRYQQDLIQAEIGASKLMRT